MERSLVIRQLMNDKNMKVSDVSKESGIPYSTIKSILEKGTEKASYINICKICSALGITSDELEKLVKNQSTKSDKFSQDDLLLIKKYRSLDPYGQETVNIVLDREIARAQQLQDAKIHQTPAATRIYTYMHKIACAGSGYYFDDIPTDTMEAPYQEDADFIFGVSGDSMEPSFSDGDLVYVQKKQILSYGEIGIFILNGECLIKEAGEAGLISHNKKYDVIPGSEDIICVGKVLGKVATE